MSKSIKHVTPVVLSYLGAFGVIATSILAAKATPKALTKIRDDSCAKHNGNPEAYTKIEAIRSAWTCYIPASIMGTTTIICIFGANILNKRQQVAISSAYALLSTSYQEYKDKVKEIYGEEAHRKIIDSLMVEKAKDVYMYTNGICDTSSLTFDNRDEEEVRLFYDSFSKRYFEASLSQVLEAEYHLNRNFCLGYPICLNYFYELLGLSGVDGGDELSWFWSDEIVWIDFDHHKTTLEDGLEVCVVDFVYYPRFDDDDD